MENNLINLALTQYGVREIKGNSDNPEIIKYFTEIGFTAEWIKDETAWCSAFTNWVCKKAGAAFSGKLNARSWLRVGEETKEPKVGDIVVFWRENPKSWKGHVAFYVNEDDNFIWVLGGNQNNEVNIKKYSKSRLLEYRKVC